ncbi:hypothetical protein UPYG_G00022290 [Umbra pygmaea]|uniref:Uncharacterized protein n=1 Tax=Umbra pygmaea TaxID=75934 RepID=A0ABD0XN92_UMBPY
MATEIPTDPELCWTSLVKNIYIQHLSRESGRLLGHLGERWPLDNGSKRLMKIGLAKNDSRWLTCAEACR